MKKKTIIFITVITILGVFFLGNTIRENSRSIVAEEPRRSVEDIEIGIVQGDAGLSVTTIFDVSEETVVDKDKRVSNRRINEALPFDIKEKFEVKGSYSFEIPVKFNGRPVKMGTLKTELLSENYTFQIKGCKDQMMACDFIGRGSIKRPLDLLYTIEIELVDGEIIEVSRVGWNAEPFVFSEAEYAEEDLDESNE